jgi:glyoxylase-like metal-dependent hydrolase (beta-lactamase superfamily II)
MRVGDFELTSLSDGFTLIDRPILMGDPDTMNRLAEAAYLTRWPLQLSVNCFLVNTGDSLILIDAGAGELMLPSMGHLDQSLAAAGVNPADIDQVLITHLHGDHIGGAVTPEGKARFPNALIRAGQADIDYWTSEANMNQAAERKVRFVASRRAAMVYGSRLQSVAPGAAIVPGIQALDSSGHTPGHTSYMIESGGTRVLATGDFLHVAPLQFSRPEITVRYDSDPDTARQVRRRLLDAAAAEQWILAIPHAPFPGLGRVRRDGASYLFDALPWQMF